MNYNKIYNNLINRAKTRIADVYTESHHIIPRCIGGTDDKLNLVRLTPEEHYVAHQLLAKMHPHHSGLAYAAMMMCINRPTNKLYGWVRRRVSEAQSQKMTGSGNNMFGSRWIANHLEVIKVDVVSADRLIAIGSHIPGKLATIAPCGCLVKKRCLKHEDKKYRAYERKRQEFLIETRLLFNEFIESEAQSITEFAKLKGTSQPALTIVWKKHIPEYQIYVSQGKSFKKSADL